MEINSWLIWKKEIDEKLEIRLGWALANAEKIKLEKADLKEPLKTGEDFGRPGYLDWEEIRSVKITGDYNIAFDLAPIDIRAKLLWKEDWFINSDTEYSVGAVLQMENVTLVELMRPDEHTF